MSSQHKAPLAAFLVVSIACIVVVVNALRSDALSGIFANPSQAVIAAARLVPAPEDILSTEARVVSRASAGLAVTPKVAHEVVSSTADPVGHAATKPKSHHAHHRARNAVTSAAVTQTVVSTPSVPTTVSTTPDTTPDTTPPTTNTHGHGTRGWSNHSSHHATAATQEQPAYSHEGHQSDSSAYSNSQWGWGGSKSHHDNRGHGSRGQSSSGYDDRSNAVPSSSNGHSSGRGHGSRRGDDEYGRGGTDRGNGWGNGRGDDRGNSWSGNDRGNGWGSGRGNGRGHGWS
jgi:hypothetical protein